MSVLSYSFIAFIAAFLCCTLMTAFLIPRLRAMKMGQKILEIGPVWHAPKEGTPTMGGISFLASSLLVGGILCPFLLREYALEAVYPFIVTLLYCIANGAIGIVDDLTKLRHHRNEGLTPTQKLVLQTTLAAAYLALMRLCGLINDAISLPFFGEISLGFATYAILMLLLVGMTNCANLTDGIDGLASSVGAIICAAFALFSIWRDLLAPALLSSLLFGCTLAFLFFNRHPARIFMGDTGSLFIGAAVGSVPILLNSPLLGIMCGILYVVEGASVLLQVAHYKRTKKRLFLMAPIHHHFEKCGWSENKIVALFSLATVLACTLAAFLP
ncbi:MAG: phospho-N-acetylmuramoyl-pentapeptide-transferase [Clostridia bacterium]|nr:phospho-N-acetylmuramoyl-pentapeptide-transferase [Clostridia bacterium]